LALSFLSKRNMTTNEIIQSRLINQQIAYSRCSEPAELISWLAAMQAQEYPMAKWAVGLRLKDISDSRIEEDFNRGSILRTHMLRPTWHFVTPADIRWILSLSSPTVHAFNAYYYRQTELDAKLLSTAMKSLQKMLAGKNFLNRVEIHALLEKDKIKAKGLRFGLILMFAELEALICSGPRIGKQFTYALLEERTDSSLAFQPKDPLSELTTRYFSARGPATARDFMWWSGLKAAQVKKGINSLPGTFKSEIFQGQEYIFQPINHNAGRKMQSSFLLPDYDEYGISYKNRDAYTPRSGEAPLRKLNSSFKHYLVIHGRIGGKWKRVELKGRRSAQSILLPGLSSREKNAAEKAIIKYNRFVNPQEVK
jgi:Winged helix DNA-binding domain